MCIWIDVYGYFNLMYIKGKVMKKVLKKKVSVEFKGNKIKIVGGNGNNIGVYIKKRILEMGKSKDGLDMNKLDVELFEKFGISKSGEESRLNSIRWHLNKMKNGGMEVS